MSLNVDASRVKNAETVCFRGEGDKREWNPLTTLIAFTTMSVDIGEITAENAEEFYCRAALINDIYASASSLAPTDITIADIKAHIGLRTNVATLTRAKWLAKVSKVVIPNRLRAYKYRLDRAEQANITSAAEQPATA
jgi:hypothetical protein